MAHFHPSRASPARHLPKRTSEPQPSRFDLNTSSTTSVSSEALNGLTQDDVQLIDEIIKRAPASTTTFLNVFKAYNEVLQERGLDSGSDVVYYKMLLKIGVVRGSDWGAKWAAVKEQYGYACRNKINPNDTSKGPVSTSSRAALHGTRASRIHPRTRENFLTPAGRTRHNEVSSSEEMSDSGRTSSPRTLVQRPTLKDFMKRPLDSGDVTQSELHMPSISEFVPVHARSRNIEYSQASTSVVSAEIVPHVSIRTNRPSRPAIDKKRPPHRADVPASPFSLLAPSDMKTDGLSPEPKKASLNTEDAWNKIKLDMDEKYADDVYDEHLVYRHFLTWHGQLSRIRVCLHICAFPSDC
jgi:protein SFI1